ncbi:hypothetical protein MUK42_36889 [Musa troglodytarum]|uniref:Uncharacterized protein n=1 Tax=Musa troglodytarum TaxID=320322 RepID=A0A9E7KBN2_9LILI|nr:hypothetical protein MUK42_36889 [Musa troglodytarum]
MISQPCVQKMRECSNYMEMLYLQLEVLLASQFQNGR